MATKSGYLQNGQIVNNTVNRIGIALDSGEFPVRITNSSGTLYASNGLGDKKIYVQLCESDGSNAYTMATLDGSSLVMVLGNNSPTYSASPVRCYNLAGKSIYIKISGLNYIQQNYTSGTSITIETSTKQSYTLTLSKGTGIASVTGGGSIEEMASTNISATASTGYTFSKWTSNNGGTFGNPNSASTTFTMPIGNTTVTASATINSYTLTVAKGTGIASVTGGGTVNYGSSNSISATVSTGYSFKNWTSNNGGSFANANSASTAFTMPAGAVTVTANGQINSYTLTTTVSPSGSGSVTAGGSLNYGATKSLTATANSGYTFSSWSKTAGSLSSTTSNPTTFTMGTSAATVTANFSVNSYTLTVSKGTGIASVTGGGTVAYKSSNNISATVSNGYTFNKWTSNNGGTFGSATSASTTFTMPVGNTTVTASATANSYTLTVSKGTGISSVSGGGSKQYTSVNAISATVSTGYSFKNWTSNNGGTFANANAASTNFTMPIGNTTVTANGQINSYTLSTAVSPSGGGTVTAGATLNYGATKSLTATASSGYSFSSWSKTAGTLSSTTTNPTTFTMGTSAATVTANFTKNSYTLTVAKGTGIASVTGGGSVQYTASTNISATVSNGYTFNKWTSNNGGTFGSTTSASTTFTMPVGNTTVTASATANSYTLTVSKGTGVASVTGGGSVQYTTATSISATVSNGYSFNKWTSNNGGSFASATSASTTFTMPIGNTTVTASATANSYTLTVANGTGIESVTGGGSVQYTTSTAISATASTGYTFKNWTSNNGGTFANANASSTTFTMPIGNTTVTANAQINSYVLTVVASPAAGGTVTGGGTFNYDSTNSITATPATGYRFTGWTTTSGTLGDATSASTTLKLAASDATATASFEKITYNITTDVSPAGSGTLTYSGTRQYGETIMLSMTAATGYQFSSYTTDPVVTIMNNQFIMPASDISITANFVKIDYAITVDIDPSGSGTVLAPATANYGDTVTLTATPALGYLFDYWSSADVTITNDQFTMPAGNVTITAHFILGASTPYLDKSSYTAGETAVLTIDASSGTYSHQYKLSFGDDLETEWITLEAGVDTANIFIPVEWAAHLIDSPSVSTGTLELRTYINNTYIGSKTITDLTYNALDNTILSLRVWRVDENGDANIYGRYANYSLSKASSINQWMITSNNYNESSPPATGTVLNNNRLFMDIDEPKTVTLIMSTDTETITIHEQVPMVKAVDKKITNINH